MNKAIYRYELTPTLAIRRDLGWILDRITAGFHVALLQFHQ